jgi:hypothetical protein
MRILIPLFLLFIYFFLVRMNLFSADLNKMNGDPILACTAQGCEGAITKNGCAGFQPPFQ